MLFELKDGEPLHRALSKFNRKVLREGIIREHREHSHYVKPSEKRRKKILVATARRARAERNAARARAPDWGKRR